MPAILTEIQCIQNVSVNIKGMRGTGAAIPRLAAVLENVLGLALMPVTRKSEVCGRGLYAGSEMHLAHDHFINKVNIDFRNILFMISWFCRSLEVKILTFTRLFVPAF